MKCVTFSCQTDNVFPYIIKAGPISVDPPSKGNVQEPASRHNLIVVCPDTSPRGLEIEGEEDNWDFGTGAGFYVDATVEKWKQYRMYSYGNLFIIFDNGPILPIVDI